MNSLRTSFRKLKTRKTSTDYQYVDSSSSRYGIPPSPKTRAKRPSKEELRRKSCDELIDQLESTQAQKQKLREMYDSFIHLSTDELPRGSTQENEKETTVEEQRDISVIVIGAGRRGAEYASYARDFPTRMKVVAVAEPTEKKVARFKKTYHILDENIMQDWKEILNQPKFADAVIVALPAILHKEVCIACAEKGYHILVQQPLSLNEKDCDEILEACKKRNVMLVVGHTLRYKPQFVKAKELLENDAIGDIINVQIVNPIGWYRFAHSFVRGKRRRTAESGSTLLSMCCDDFDLLNFIMDDTKCTSLNSSGSLSHFTLQNKPKYAGHRCVECDVKSSCPYSAIKVYVEPLVRGKPNAVCSALCDTLDVEEIEERLRHGSYGKCVYDCDNDVVSNQVTNLVYEGGKTATIMFTAFSEKMSARQVKIFGSKGEITCNEGEETVLFSFLNRKRTIFPRESPKELTSMIDNGFADYYLMHAFVKAVACNDPSIVRTSMEDFSRAHKLIFLSEQARLENKTLQCVETLLEV